MAVRARSAMSDASLKSSDPAAGPLGLMRVLQLASPTLPVGAYSYSQGLEWAVAEGTVRDEATASAWIKDVLRTSIATFELPCLARMLVAAAQADRSELRRLNTVFLAGREGAELRAETVQMGRSLVRLLGELPDARETVAVLHGITEPSYPCAFAVAARAFALHGDRAREAYAWAWLENQVLAAVKLVPLGQSAGQRMLFALGRSVAAACAAPVPDEDAWTNFAPAFGLASSAHETQYTRLFRS